MPTGWLTEDLRIVCLGDSNTYGVYLDPASAYPQQLEALWNDSGGSRAEVLNLGFPGTNSSKLVDELPRLLDALQPDFVTILIGANDLWTQSLVAPSSSEVQREFWRLLERHSRLVRLLQIIRRRLDPLELEVRNENSSDRGSGKIASDDFEVSFGWARKDVRSALRDAIALEANLHELIRRTREHGVKLVLLTYPSSIRQGSFANPLIRRAARATGTTLVDLAEVFASECPDEECGELLLPDHHPRASGHRLIAETLLARLRADEESAPERPLR
jgi:lysophospholipase L1-like esterase